jgi:ornithine carbamoyltransferase
MALEPPPLDLIRSGQRDAIARRSHNSELREVSTVRCSAPAARASSGGHHGGTSCNSATSHSQPAIAPANSCSSGRPAGGWERPWKRFQVRTRTSPDCTLARLPRHFLTGEELSPHELTSLLDRALALKAAPASSRALEGRTVALLFEHPSTRTRTSFEAGIVELGGHPMVLRAGELQLSRGESLRDTALVFSRHAAAIGLRTGSEETLRELAAHATVPVVNMLSPEHHPCQALADLVTLREAFGAIEGRTLAYVGDGNNVARSLAVLGGAAGLEVRVSAPAGLQLPEAHGAALMTDPREAADGADVLYTDVWVSMGDDASDAARRRELLAPYRLDDALLDRAAPGAFALHCLPAHPGEEITESVLYGERQRIWDQAENRRHAQKALLELLVSGG